MKKLFKVKYDVAFYVEEEYIYEIAQDFVDEACNDSVALDESSVKEIKTIKDIPNNWDKDWFPIINSGGDVADNTTMDIFEQLEKDFPLHEKIKALEQEIKGLKKQLNNK